MAGARRASARITAFKRRGCSIAGSTSKTFATHFLEPADDHGPGEEIVINRFEGALP